MGPQRPSPWWRSEGSRCPAGGQRPCSTPAASPDPRCGCAHLQRQLKLVSTCIRHGQSSRPRALTSSDPLADCLAGWTGPGGKSLPPSCRLTLLRPRCDGRGASTSPSPCCGASTSPWNATVSGLRRRRQRKHSTTLLHFGRRAEVICCRSCVKKGGWTPCCHRTIPART